MIEYIYFVKCPNCEDEPFDFFDEAKTFAMNCLTQKPVITQVEVDRNDFGECTDSHDLGTVWSWEDMMKDMPKENELTTFSKSETFGQSDDFFNCEFDDLDSVPDNFERPVYSTPGSAECVVTESYEDNYSVDYDEDEMIPKGDVAAAIEAGKEVTINLGNWESAPQEVYFSDGGVYSDSFIRVYKAGTEYAFGIWHRSDDGDE